MKMLKAYLFILFFVCLLLNSCSHDRLFVSEKQGLMDTYVTITVVADSQETADKAIEMPLTFLKSSGYGEFFF